MPAATRERARVRGDIVRLVHRELGIDELTRAASRALARAVPFDGICLLTMDPATLLPTGEVVEDGLPDELMVRLTEIELRERDYNKFTALARARRPAASLSDATAGELDRSLRQRELRRPSGFDDELRVVLADATGSWGALTLLREAKRPRFSAVDVRFVASLAGMLAEGVRRAALAGDPVANGAGDTPGVLILAPDGTVELADQAADQWLDELGADHRAGTPLPSVIRNVATRTRHAATEGTGAGTAFARVRTATGRWVVVRGSLVGDGVDARVAIVVDAARAPELAPLIASAYGLTERERSITELVAQGFSTNEIAARVHLSAYTVQDHLKSIFSKSGTSSRGDLVARLFFDHYAPQLTLADDQPAAGSAQPGRTSPDS